MLPVVVHKNETNETMPLLLLYFVIVHLLGKAREQLCNNRKEKVAKSRGSEAWYLGVLDF